MAGKWKLVGMFNVRRCYADGGSGGGASSDWQYGGGGEKRVVRSGISKTVVVVKNEWNGWTADRTCGLDLGRKEGMWC
jgi:hypothetical protein